MQEPGFQIQCVVAKAVLPACLADTGGVIWPDSVHDVIVPVVLLGVALGGRPVVLASAVALSAASMTVALIWVDRTDIRLEAAQ